MNSNTFHRRALLAAGTAVLVAPMLLADSNVAAPRQWAWGENIGWTNWRDANGTTQGVEIYRNSHLQGWIWAENVGWINVGNGAAPYTNTTGLNFGINLTPSGPTTATMSGFAWGENIGWVNFGPFPPATGVASPTWDYVNHRTNGWAWGENVGWINLNDALASICSPPGDMDHDGDVDLSDFTLLATNFGATGITTFTLGDSDGDGNVTLTDFTELATNFGFVCP